MYFTEEQIKEIAADYESLPAKHEDLMKRFVWREYNEPRSKEFAQHGFMRRINSMMRSITNVFSLLPPENNDIPSREARRDAEINIQAFLFNTFAATDNLAWIWVNEKNIRKPDGGDLSHGDVGLRKKRVRDTFSEDFQEYLARYEDWFVHLEDFRHALAHRIPLYIPPHMIDQKNEKEYRSLEQAMNAASERGDIAEHDRLSTEQMKLVFFRPWMTHSFIENAKHVVFHAQLLTDFNTIDELAHKFLEELDQR